MRPEEFKSRIIKTSTCWLYQGEHNKKGYGRVVYNGKHSSAHRFAYELFVGPIHSNLHVLHSCDNPGCINPDHLHLGTNLENQRERVQRGRSNFGEKAWSAKLKEKDVKTIRYRRSKLGHTVTALSKDYGVHSSQISRICLRQKWAYL